MRQRMCLWPHLDAEYQQELTGIAEGLKAHGSKLDLWDVVALNGYIELSDYYVPWLDAKQGTSQRRRARGAGQMQRVYCHRVGDQGREDCDRAQQLELLCGRRALDRGL